MKKVNLETGTSLLEFSITGLFLTFILLALVNIFMKRYAMENFELYTSQIAREIVVCESLEEAQKMAKDLADIYFPMTTNIDSDSLKIYVDYTIGSPTEWKKGSYIDVCVSGTIYSFNMFLPSEYESEIMVMVEKGS